MSKQTIGWGVLGCANIAYKQFLPALRQSKYGYLQAVASRDPEKAKSFATEFAAAKVYTDYEELLTDPEVDAVYIPLPNHMHKQWTLVAQACGKSVLCEKPLALTSADAKQMYEAFEGHSTILMEAFMYSFHPQIAKAQGLISENRIGKLTHIRGSFRFKLDNTNNIRMIPAYGGGSIWDVGCYPIHFSNLIMGRAPKEVSAIAHYDGPRGVDLSFYGLLDYGDGITAMIDSSFESCQRQSAEIIGDKGRIFLDTPWRADNKELNLHLITDNIRETFGFPVSNPYVLEIDHFSQCVQECKQPKLAPSSTIYTMNTIEALLKSSKTGQKVFL